MNNIVEKEHLSIAYKIKEILSIYREARASIN